MILIGICDDIEKERLDLYHLCERFFKENVIEHKYIYFSSGEAVLQYCANVSSERIDLLFLDVEMEGISGIELKDAVIKQSIVWRIAFVTSHTESIYGAFSLKTIGFIPKPASEEKVSKMINLVLEDLKENILVTFKGYRGENISIRLEDIAYFEARGSYTELFTYLSWQETIIAKKIGEIEKELQPYNFVRVHKSYMVNLSNVIDVRSNVFLKDIEREIPIGRIYKETVRNRYSAYGKEKIKKRL